MALRLRVALLSLAVVASSVLLIDATPASAATVDETDFNRGTLAGSGFATIQPTTLAFGPDGRLFVADQEGRIQALTLDAAGTAVTALEEVTTNADLQEVFGIAFDPAGGGSPPAVFVTNTVSGFGAAGPAPAGSFPGKITVINGPGYSKITDIITGLSTSDSAHQANGISFGPDGRLYIAHGSTTNAGVDVPGGPLFERPDVPLSGAVLVTDFNVGIYDGAVTYSPAGVYSSTVDQVSGDVSVYASGLRNPYDLVWHSNGKLYATDNGPNAGLGGGSTSCTTEDPDPWAPDDRGPDELNLIEAGEYYGQPNRNRGRFDVRQCIYHNGTEGDGADWTGPIDLLPVSTNGIVEYTAGTFSGKLQGDLFYVALIAGQLGRIQLSGDGSSVISQTTFADGFVFPLDVTVGSGGTIYVAEFGGSVITYLKPKTDVIGGISLGGDIAGLRDPSSGFSSWFIAGAMALLASMVFGGALSWRVAHREN